MRSAWVTHMPAGDAELCSQLALSESLWHVELRLVCGVGGTCRKVPAVVVLIGVVPIFRCPALLCCAVLCPWQHHCWGGLQPLAV